MAIAGAGNLQIRAFFGGVNHVTVAMVLMPMVGAVRFTVTVRWHHRCCLPRR